MTKEGRKGGRKEGWEKRMKGKRKEGVDNLTFEHFLERKKERKKGEDPL